MAVAPKGSVHQSPPPSSPRNANEKDSNGISPSTPDHSHTPPTSTSTTPSTSPTPPRRPISRPTSPTQDIPPLVATRHQRSIQSPTSSQATATSTQSQVSSQPPASTVHPPSAASGATVPSQAPPVLTKVPSKNSQRSAVMLQPIKNYAQEYSSLQNVWKKKIAKLNKANSIKYTYLAFSLMQLKPMQGTIYIKICSNCLNRHTSKN